MPGPLDGWNINPANTEPPPLVPPPLVASYEAGPANLHSAFPGVQQQSSDQVGFFSGWNEYSGSSAPLGAPGHTPWQQMGNLSPTWGSRNEAPPHSAPPGPWGPPSQYPPSQYPSQYPPSQYPSPGSTSVFNTPAPSWGSHTPRSMSFGPPTPAMNWSAPESSDSWFGAGAGISSEQPLSPGGWFGAKEVQSYPTTPAHGAWSAGDLAGGGEMQWPSSSNPFFEMQTEALQRSASTKRSRKRAASFGGAGAAEPSQWHYQPESYSEDNLALRPRDWRADYSPRGGLNMMSMIARQRSDVKEMNDPVKRTLHQLLKYGEIAYDLRVDPRSENSLTFASLGRRYNNLDLMQLATSPPASIMRLYHPRLPWYIDVLQTHVNGVTLFDILGQMYDQLLGGRSRLTSRHYYNEDLNKVERQALNLAYKKRCNGDHELLSGGLLKIDFLGMDDLWVFTGLVRGKNGMWEMKLRKA